jgi:hypothetical protein
MVKKFEKIEILRVIVIIGINPYITMI